MRINYLLIVLFIFGGGAVLWAQESDQPADPQSDTAGIPFRIQDYVPEVFQSRLRWVTMNANSSPEIKGWTSSYNLGDEGGLVDELKIPLQGGASFTQSNYAESPTRVSDTRLSALVNFSFSSQTSKEDFKASYPYHYYRNDGQSKSRAVNGYLNSSWKRLYYNSAARFMLINPNISYSSRSRYSNQDTERFNLDPNSQAVDRYSRSPRTDKRINRQVTFFSSLELGVGRGRIYEATTTWHTIELLKTVGRQSSVPLEDIAVADFQRLADVLYELRVTKYPSQDRARLSAFDRTERVLQVLEDAFGDTALAPRTIATVHDILRFYPQVSRRFGRRIYISLIPGAIYTRNSYETEADNEYYYYRGGVADSNLYSSATNITRSRSSDSQAELTATLRAGVVSRTPLDIDWQFDWEGSIDIYQRWANKSSSQYNFSGSSTTDTVVFDDWEREMDAYPWTNFRLTMKGKMDLTHIISSRTYWMAGVHAVMEPYLSSSRQIVLLDPEDQEGQYKIDKEIKYILGQVEASFNWHHSLAWQTYINVATGLNFIYNRIRYTEDTWRDTENWTIAPRGSINLSHYF